MREKGVAETNAYTTAWELLIYLAALGSIQEKMSSKQRSNFNKFLHDLQVQDRQGRLNQMFDWLSRIKKLNLPNISTVADLGGVEFDTTSQQTLDDKFIQVFNQFQKFALEILAEFPRTVLIDRIDEAWDGSEEARLLIIGAIKAMRDINLKVKPKGLATVIIFLRTDLWQAISFNDRNKVSQDIEYLDWSDDDLIKVIEARIKSSVGNKQSSSSTWHSLFYDGEMRQRARSETYMLKRTMGRPRDIVAFSISCLEEAQRNGHSLIEREDIYSAEPKYCMHVLEELRDEFSHTIDNFQSVLNLVRKLRKRNFFMEDWLTVAQAQNVCEEEARIWLNLLFEASVVGVFEIGGGGGGSRCIYRYQDLNVQPEEESHMQVHLAVAKALKLKDS
ncbi:MULTISPECIES: P-loop ATPase, Sll1717 family [unclassified Corynebacterium]|uniref:P-loop ATPase, Sll1717 family n=2 Tax=unclassified Corynebacterium TaxID=2624378 RepID=UPI00351CD30B